MWKQYFNYPFSCDKLKAVELFCFPVKIYIYLIRRYRCEFALWFYVVMSNYCHIVNFKFTGWMFIQNLPYDNSQWNFWIYTHPVNLKLTIMTLYPLHINIKLLLFIGGKRIIYVGSFYGIWISLKDIYRNIWLEY